MNRVSRIVAKVRNWRPKFVRRQHALEQITQTLISNNSWERAAFNWQKALGNARKAGIKDTAFFYDALYCIGSEIASSERLIQNHSQGRNPRHYGIEATVLDLEIIAKHGKRIVDLEKLRENLLAAKKEFGID